ncbi:signal recognition particle-docking protein FtsY [Crenobacter caeni]|uniref:Signal recognition particle receptor FtsY n=1 Tax=Crenobacter caeni TaxID=2705474 RepID=A0A6B2KMW0_9NEIS|nr:signal recognition particle-docking protein FtsY [Crenobacter caeni]NDV11488.1 signal recognition particle-docking protein FtsY [Crenobacter caeni]
MFSFFKRKPKDNAPQANAPATPETAPIQAPDTTAPVPEPVPAVTPAQPVPVAEPVAAYERDELPPTSAPAPDAGHAVPAPAAVPIELPEAPAPAPSAPAEPDAQAVPERKLSWTERLKAGLAKTRSKLGKQLAGLFGGGKIDEDLYEELETVLLTADMGVDATMHLLGDVRERVSLKGLKDASELKGALKDSLLELIGPLEQPLSVEGKQPFVIMMAGVNGAGKTTSIGKLAKYYQSQGKKVMLAAGDTFRAAAREQLMAWGERNNVTVIAQQGGDAAAVCFDAIQAAKARGIDVVLADTAGRLPTQLHLMEEIKKVKRVIQKAIPDGPHEVMLVIDANTGQNAVTQVKAFDDALGLTGLILSKLDGSAKGGVIAAIAKQRPVPLRFVGVGESIDDLRPFSARDYVDALFD